MKQDFLLEILCEELPHAFLDPEKGECRKIIDALEKKFTNLKIPFQRRDFFLTPRRIAVIFREMEGVIPAQKVVTKGPPIKICFQEGKATPALIGFMKGFPQEKKIFNGEQLPLWEERNRTSSQPGFYQQVVNKDMFLIHYDYISEQKVTKMLKIIVPEVLKNITFAKSMYWGNKKGPFLRPIRSLLALWGKEVVPFVFSGITADNKTRGHRFLSFQDIIVPESSSYQEVLQKEKVIVDHKHRLEIILKEVAAIEKERKVRVVDKTKIAHIVSQLTEYPVLVFAEVDIELIHIPREVVVSEMVEHQMYFPVEDEKGSLTHSFVFTANGIQSPTVITGNCNVLSSRLRDGIFLFKEDIKTGLEELSAKTDKIVFESNLGTYADKCFRISKLALLIKEHSKDIFSQWDEKTISAVSFLIKCDLASGMVYEFPHLQGVMGKYYAENGNSNKLFKGIVLNEEMGKAIKEHYLPLSAQGDMPTTQLGLLFSLSDKLDNLLGLFAVKLIPSGNNDPYALRRQGYGLLRLLGENCISLSLEKVLEEGAQLYDFRPQEKNWFLEVNGFLESRFKTYGKDKGFTSDEIEAVSVSNSFNVHKRLLKMQAIKSNRGTSEFASLLEIFKRVVNITEEKFASHNKSDYCTIDKDIILKYLSESVEIELFQTYQDLQLQGEELVLSGNYSELLKMFNKYQDVLGRFFDEVLVNVDDKNLRRARLEMLKAIKQQISQYFDLRKIKIVDN